MAAYARLQARYVRRFDPETANYLAAAVVNSLFSQRAVDGEAGAFRQRNEALIAGEMAALRDDPELCQVVPLSRDCEDVIKMENVDREEEG